MPLTEREAIAVKATGQFLGEVLKALDAQIAALEKRIKALEGRGYKGVYQRALAYAVGDEVTADGALYVAIAPAGVNEAPGKSPAWQLCAKNVHAQEKRLPTGHRPNGHQT